MERARQSIHLDTSVTTPQKGNASACVALTGLANDCNTPSTFESNYGLSSLESSNAGAGQTLAPGNSSRILSENDSAL